MQWRHEGHELSIEPGFHQERNGRSVFFDGVILGRGAPGQQIPGIRLR